MTGTNTRISVYRRTRTHNTRERERERKNIPFLHNSSFSINSNNKSEIVAIGWYFVAYFLLLLHSFFSFTSAHNVMFFFGAITVSEHMRVCSIHIHTHSVWPKKHFFLCWFAHAQPQIKMISLHIQFRLPTIYGVLVEFCKFEPNKISSLNNSNPKIVAIIHCHTIEQMLFAAFFSAKSTKGRKLCRKKNYYFDWYMKRNGAKLKVIWREKQIL